MFPTLCAGKADTQGRQAHIQTPTLPDVATSETESAICLRRFPSPQDQVDLQQGWRETLLGPVSC